ncbi:hypothetical protein A4G28_25885 [Mycobacterium ostraviense]|uniref:Uncharacterized protein n=1 Tax=Mycobacterium ostraviense TaxID=2738409 RepID=A0A164AAS7_9MYCO|nr:hypothetical protein A4G28_25885 [Mycobacterium ostraviense]
MNSKQDNDVPMDRRGTPTQLAAAGTELARIADRAAHGSRCVVDSQTIGGIIVNTKWVTNSPHHRPTKPHVNGRNRLPESP